MSNTNWNPKVDGAVHVFPMNDSRKHKASPDCECKPTVMVVGPTTVYTHNPFVDLPQFGIDHRVGDNLSPEEVLEVLDLAKEQK